MSSIPREKTIDSSLALLREGYEFIPRRCRKYRSDLFETRVMLQRVICMSGPAAAEVFYDGDRFTRRRAIPRPTLTLLQDFGSVQGLDGEAHRHRKQMWMGMMGTDALARLAALSEREWRAAIERWTDHGEIVLDVAVRELLCRVACAWAGVPVGDSEVGRRASDLAAQFDGAGSIGARQVRGQIGRRRTEAWIEAVVDGVRGGALDCPPGWPAQLIATHRDLDGGLLPRQVATVELLNVLRPTVAVTRFVTFAALALHDHPEWTARLRADATGDLERFANELRRFYPFFPLITGRAIEDFQWHDHRFAPGDWAMLDLYGTNHDPRAWEEPERFDPDRFRAWDESPFSLVAQGAGDHYTGHRCPGEWATNALIESALRMLSGAMEYRVPPQNLTYSLSRMPTLPKSRFRIREVRPLAHAC